MRPAVCGLDWRSHAACDPFGYLYSEFHVCSARKAGILLKRRSAVLLPRPMGASIPVCRQTKAGLGAFSLAFRKNWVNFAARTTRSTGRRAGKEANRG